MQRRIQKPDGNGISFKSLIKLLKIALLVRKYLIKRRFPLFCRIGTDHFPYSSDPVFFKEHMLRTAETYTLCTKLPGLLCIPGSICICPYLHPPEFVSPLHYALKFTCNGSIYSRNDTFIDLTRSTVYRDLCSFGKGLSGYSKFLILFIHIDIAAA